MTYHVQTLKKSGGHCFHFNITVEQKAKQTTKQITRLINREVRKKLKELRARWNTGNTFHVPFPRLTWKVTAKEETGTNTQLTLSL